MKKITSTNELLKRLENAKKNSELESIVTKTAPVQTFPEYIEEKRKEVGISPAELIEKAQLQRNYGYQVLNGIRHPGRDKVIALCLAMKLPLSDVQRALAIAEEGTLYPKKSRDSVLIFCIHQKMSVMETNDLLAERKEATLQ